jgi:hypothetical protein
LLKSYFSEIVRLPISSLVSVSSNDPRDVAELEECTLL